MAANLWSPGASDGGDWRSAALSRAPQIVTFVLALAVAAQLALIVVGLTGRTRQAPPPVAALPAAPPLDIGALINAHLFGNAAAQASGDAANAPATSMPLVLTGLFATEDPKEGMAIIGESSQAAKFVTVGQQVPGGAQLHSVYNDRAIIERAGVLESVFLPKSTGGSLAMSAPPPPRGKPRATKPWWNACARWSTATLASSATSCARRRYSLAARCADSAYTPAATGKPSPAWACGPGTW